MKKIYTCLAFYFLCVSVDGLEQKFQVKSVILEDLKANVLVLPNSEKGVRLDISNQPDDVKVYSTEAVLRIEQAGTLWEKTSGFFSSNKNGSSSEKVLEGTKIILYVSKNIPVRISVKGSSKVFYKAVNSPLVLKLFENTEGTVSAVKKMELLAAGNSMAKIEKIVGLANFHGKDDAKIHVKSGTLQTFAYKAENNASLKVDADIVQAFIIGGGKTTIDLKSVSSVLKAEGIGTNAINVQSVNGYVKLVGRFNSKFSVMKGVIDKLEASAASSSAITVDAVVQNARLDATGSGKIYIKKLRGVILDEVIKSNGKIVVEHESN